MKKRFLFVDDSAKRIRGAIAKWGEKYELVICPNVLEALRSLSQENWDFLSLDCDLGGQDYCDLDGKNTIMWLVRYLEKTGWPPGKQKPKVYVHSSNAFAANLVIPRLKKIFGAVEYTRFVYPEFKRKKYGVGFIAGAFDVIHPGYIALLREAKELCEMVVIGLHEDPSVENQKKDKPVLSVAERMEILLSLRFVDEVKVYRLEAELVALLQEIKPDVRLLGDDYKNKAITGADLNIPIHYHVRSTWSASRFKRMITGSVEEE